LGIYGFAGCLNNSLELQQLSGAEGLWKPNSWLNLCQFLSITLSQWRNLSKWSFHWSKFIKYSNLAAQLIDLVI